MHILMHIEIQNCFSFWVPQTPYRGFAPGPHWGTSVPQTPLYRMPPPTFCTRFTPLHVSSKGGGAQRPPNICLLHVRTTQYEKHQTNVALHAREENLQGSYHKC